MKKIITFADRHGMEIEDTLDQLARMPHLDDDSYSAPSAVLDDVLIYDFNDFPDAPDSTSTSDVLKTDSDAEPVEFPGVERTVVHRPMTANRNDQRAAPESDISESNSADFHLDDHESVETTGVTHDHAENVGVVNEDNAMNDETVDNTGVDSEDKRMTNADDKKGGLFDDMPWAGVFANHADVIGPRRRP